MSLINRMQEDRLRRIGQDSHYRPIVDAIKAVQHDGVSSQEVVQTALRATRDQYVKEGRKLDPENVRRDAYTAASVSAVESPYQMSDLPEGDDKTKHFMVSGEIASRIDQGLDALKVVPQPARRAIAVGLTTGIGFLKEVLDIFGTGFNRQDLKADVKGAKAPFSEPPLG